MSHVLTGDLHVCLPQGKGKKKDKSALPKMTYEERRAKFLKHNKSVRVNKPGSHKRVVRATPISTTHPHLISQHRMPSQVCFGCRKPGHRMEKCPEKDQATHICFNCGSERHALRDCPQPSAGGEAVTHIPHAAYPPTLSQLSSEC